jgi:hypothetical protein
MYLNKGRILYFMWMALNDIPHWSTVELSLKFLIYTGVPIDDVNCFEQFINPKKLPEG